MENFRSGGIQDSSRKLSCELHTYIPRRGSVEPKLLVCDWSFCCSIIRKSYHTQSSCCFENIESGSSVTNWINYSKLNTVIRESKDEYTLLLFRPSSTDGIVRLMISEPIVSLILILLSLHSVRYSFDSLLQVTVMMMMMVTWHRYTK